MDPKRDKSRNAAKSRRLTESEVFAQLEETLPLNDRQTIYQLDRIAVLRLVLTLCRLRRVAERFFATKEEDARPSWFSSRSIQVKRSLSTDAFLQDTLSELSISHGLDGFLMIVNKGGQLLFVSSSVVDCIGFTQMDLTGRYLRDYVHVSDWPAMRDRLCKMDQSEQDHRHQHQRGSASAETFFRMKTALTPRGGRARKLTVAVYEPLEVHIIKPAANSGPTFEGYDCDGGISETAKMDEEIRLIYCIPFSLSSTRRGLIPPGSVTISRHEMNMRFRSCDESFAKLLGRENAKSMIGQSFFDHIHPCDIPGLVRSLTEVLRHSWGATGYYRLISESNTDPIWAMTEMMLLSQNVRGVEHKSVVCAHHLISRHIHHHRDHRMEGVSNQLDELMRSSEYESSDDAASNPSTSWAQQPFANEAIIVSINPITYGGYEPTEASTVLQSSAQPIPQSVFDKTMGKTTQSASYYEEDQQPQPTGRRARSNTIHGSSSAADHIKARKEMLLQEERKHRFDCKTVESFLTESSMSTTGACATPCGPLGSTTNPYFRLTSFDDFHMDDFYGHRKRTHHHHRMRCEKPEADTDLESIQKELREYFKRGETST